MAACPSCGAEILVGTWPFCPHGSILPGTAQGFEPVAVFKDSRGHFLFPGRAAQKPPAGYQRIELRTTAAVRKFEAEYGRTLKREHQAVAARDEAMYQVTRKPRLDQLRRELPHLSPRLRDVAQRVLERAAARSASADAARHNPGFYVEPFSKDQSNRMPWHDQDSRGKRK